MTDGPEEQLQGDETEFKLDPSKNPLRLLEKEREAELGIADNTTEEAESPEPDLSALQKEEIRKKRRGLTALLSGILG